MSKKIWVIILLVVVVVGVVLVLKYKTPAKPVASTANQTQTNQQGGSTPPVSVKVNNVATSTAPSGFPSDVPLEPGATITNNFNAVNASGQNQSTREFISARSESDNFAYYQKVLKDAGWTVTSATNDAARAQMLIFATKGTNNLNIRIYKDSGQVKVSINNIY
jgi:hypothetical protein